MVSGPSCARALNLYRNSEAPGRRAFEYGSLLYLGIAANVGNNSSLRNIGWDGSSLTAYRWASMVCIVQVHSKSRARGILTHSISPFLAMNMYHNSPRRTPVVQVHPA